MPKIIVRAYAGLGDIFGSRKLEVSTPAETVEELIDFLSDRYVTSLKERLIETQTGELRGSYRVLVNGREITSLNKLKTKIQEGDEITFFPPVSGG